MISFPRENLGCGQEEFSLGALVSARHVDTALGQAKAAVPVLKAELARAEGKGAKRLALEAALVLGEAELRAGIPSGPPRLIALEKEAGSLEFFRIARLAREARGLAGPSTRHGAAQP